MSSSLGMHLVEYQAVPQHKHSSVEVAPILLSPAYQALRCPCSCRTMGSLIPTLTTLPPQWLMLQAGQHMTAMLALLWAHTTRHQPTTGMAMQAAWEGAMAMLMALQG